MLDLNFHNAFKKDIKTLKKRHYDIDALKNIIIKLCNEETLPEKYKDHPLIGNYVGYRDCHIQNDWILIYKVDLQNNLLSLYRTGTHSNLFK